MLNHTQYAFVPGNGAVFVDEEGRNEREKEEQLGKQNMGPEQGKRYQDS